MTASARRADRARLYGSRPLASVWPSTRKDDRRRLAPERPRELVEVAAGARREAVRIVLERHEEIEPLVRSCRSRRGAILLGSDADGSRLAHVEEVPMTSCRIGRSVRLRLGPARLGRAQKPDSAKAISSAASLSDVIAASWRERERAPAICDGRRANVPAIARIARDPCMTLR